MFFHPAGRAAVHDILSRGIVALRRGHFRHGLRGSRPLTLERMKINPALATGPFIQITNDVVGLIIYVGVATWLLSLFA